MTAAIIILSEGSCFYLCGHEKKNTVSMTLKLPFYSQATVAIIFELKEN